ncbi:MAG TPA: hypothetical protein ENI26_14440 [Methylophaga aminisulfidivorans]|uniref:Peptidoglycan-binding protein CsiV n=2 Tax=root TaxID=1 RepID=A0A7C1W200_9GAMM|nr:hypothetical protein [Methylophaga aminisulfidivorans]
MKIQHPLITLISLLLFMSLSSSVMAAQWYQVELVVFERYSGSNAESWPEMRSINNGSLSPNSNNQLIKPATMNHLAGVSQRLSKASNYRVLYQESWRQPILSKSRSKSVNIESSNGLIEGRIKLFRISYLHADIDLWFKENGDIPFAAEDSSNVNYPYNPHLEQIRRIRSNKLNYFDHPRVAAIIQITPIATPASAAPKATETYSLPQDSDTTSAQ